MSTYDAPFFSAEEDDRHHATHSAALLVAVDFAYLATALFNAIAARLIVIGFFGTVGPIAACLGTGHDLVAIKIAFVGLCAGLVFAGSVMAHAYLGSLRRVLRGE